MSTMKNFAAITGQHPFSLNRSSFVFAFAIAVLVIAKLVDAYLFCGFNEKFFVDLPFGVVLFFGYCILPLLGLAVNREPTTKGGRCCRTFVIDLIFIWHLFIIGAIGIVPFVLFLCRVVGAAYDPFNVCGSRTTDNVRSQFSNAMPAFDIFQRIDLVFEIVVALGWLVLLPLAMHAFVQFLGNAEPPRNYQAREDPESGKPEEVNEETIVWMAESGERNTEQPSAVVASGSIDIEKGSALGDAVQEAEDRKSEVGSIDVQAENRRNEINESGSNAEPQSMEVKEPKFSIVDEEEDSNNEDSK